jgi:hypothetical protein
VDIDAVEQRTADLAEIVLDLAGGAAAFAGGIAVESALLRVLLLSSSAESSEADFLAG